MLTNASRQAKISLHTKTTANSAIVLSVLPTGQQAARADRMRASLSGNPTADDFYVDYVDRPYIDFTFMPAVNLVRGILTCFIRAAIHDSKAVSRDWALRRSEIRATLGGFPKRALDIAVASTALVLLSPVMLVIALLIRTTIGGPVLYSHTRVGYRGAQFPCYKFRSMVTNGDEVLAAHLAANPEAAKEWNTTRKLKDDPRVTPLGRILRKTSIDELPQLFNVLRGDMSCVGPRPIVQAELERYGSHASFYLRTRPGLTGMWQVNGRSKLTYRQRIALDCHYVRFWSLKRDFMLLVMTVPALLAFETTS